jgi:hypothetical protein
LKRVTGKSESNSNHRAPIGHHAALVAAGILLSRIAGLVRDRVFAYYFGSSDARTPSGPLSVFQISCKICLVRGCFQLRSFPYTRICLPVGKRMKRTELPLSCSVDGLSSLCCEFHWTKRSERLAFHIQSSPNYALPHPSRLMSLFSATGLKIQGLMNKLVSIGGR